ncbi:MAG: acetate--CoA ligase family protein [Desulfobacterales bacterium]|nr:acetate--CoA ligase family protein [Desulfobacterales bacterium]
MKTEINVQHLIEASIASGANVISEDQAKSILHGYGVPVVGEIRAADPQEAARVARQIGFPVVLKAVGTQILHKTEAGLVAVGLKSEAEVTAAAQRMMDSTPLPIDAFLVQPKIHGQREFVAGLFRDPLFGPVVMFGLGGIFTEALNDAVFKVAPLTPADIEAMFAEIRSQKMLGAFRGEAAVDKAALGCILQGLSELAMQFPQIREIDINPLIVQPDGRPVAVDALIVTGKPQPAPIKRDEVNRATLRSCYYPESVVFIGASSTISKWGHMIPTNLLNRDFKGRVYLVNPKGGQVIGREAYRSVSDIDGDIDLAVVMIPAAKVKAQIPLLRQKKVKAMLLISSGFRETGEEGRKLEDEVVAAAREAGILIFGPNTMGICNPHIDFFCCGVHVYPRLGSTSLVSQSGNMGTQLLAFAEQQDIGIRAFSGSGNEAMVTLEDYMEAFEVDELTRTVVLYIESVKDGRRFFESARRVSKQKPVVVLKGGRTSEGGQAASSHTGALASDFRIFEAACRQAGIIQVKQPIEMLDLSAVFSSLPLPKGNRVAIMTLGGGWGVVTTDLCVENGLVLPPLSKDIVQRLDQMLPDYWSRGNPADIVGEHDPNIPRTAMEALMQWDGCDAVLHLGIHGRRILAAKMLKSIARTDPTYKHEDLDQLKAMSVQIEMEYIRHVIQLTEKYQKPVLGVSLLTDEASKTLYRVEGCKYKGVFFPSPERAVKALAGMCRYRQWVAAHR